MSEQKYLGAFYAKLFDYLQKSEQDGLNIGEALAQIEISAKKRFINQQDKETYEALEKAMKVDQTDELLTDEEFNTWVNAK